MTFIKHGGKKGAALNALSNWIDETEYLEIQALIKAINSHKHADKLLTVIQRPILNKKKPLHLR